MLLVPIAFSTPVPLTAIRSGLLAALVVTTMLSFLPPMEVGVNVTVTAQLSAGASDPLQVLVSENCAPLCMANPAMVSVAVPVLVSVTAWPELGVLIS